MEWKSFPPLSPWYQVLLLTFIRQRQPISFIVQCLFQFFTGILALLNLLLSADVSLMRCVHILVIHLACPVLYFHIYIYTISMYYYIPPLFHLLVSEIPHIDKKKTWNALKRKDASVLSSIIASRSRFHSPWFWLYSWSRNRIIDYIKVLWSSISRIFSFTAITSLWSRAY